MPIDAVRAFEALAHEARLAVIRLLIPAGADGVQAGVIGDRIGIPPSALSFHLGRLKNAGLVQMRRSGRHQYYTIDYRQLSSLVGFLVEDCCADAPEGCMPECPTVPAVPTAPTALDATAGCCTRGKEVEHADS